MNKLFKSIIVLVLVSWSTFAYANNPDVLPPKQMKWSFDGPLGNFDRTSIQRGFKVYKEVCAACHSVKHLYFRNLQEIGFSAEEVKSLAASYMVKDGPNDEGEYFERPGKPFDRIPGPYANDNAARASNNGALPPDLSLIVKARVDGANYLYSLLTGFEPAPEGFTVGENMHYNPYFAGGGMQLAMTPPLVSDNQVEYSDGTKATIDQMAQDVTNFLQWAAEPEMEARKSLGLKTIIFTAAFTLIFYIAYKRIWRNVK
jgi:ubiquinol-cytochrome c reductase cytochrome c1 subunit